MRHCLVITAPELTDGVYNVVFVALSAADWHTTQGHLVFRVGGRRPDQGGIQTVSLPAISWMEVGLRWLDFIALAGLVGAIAVAFFVLRPAGHADEASIAASARSTRRVLRWAMWCALVSAVVGVARLYWQATELALPPGAGMVAGSATIETVSRLLSQTRFGSLWLARQVVVLAIATAPVCFEPPLGSRHV